MPDLIVGIEFKNITEAGPLISSLSWSTRCMVKGSTLKRDFDEIGNAERNDGCNRRPSDGISVA
jgi:hypothetical protein